MTIKAIVIANVNTPYGKAKHGFLYFPAKHPKNAINIPKHPTVRFNSPNPSVAFKSSPNLA
jgi:hypothetical protein